MLNCLLIAVSVIALWYGGVNGKETVVNTYEYDEMTADNDIDDWKRENEYDEDEGTAQSYNLTPLYRYFNGGSSFDHFYTTDKNEGDRHVAMYHYKAEGTTCYVSRTQTWFADLPLYRYYRSSGGDHLYTTNANEVGTTTFGHVGNNDYKYEGIEGYCARSGIHGAVTLYRLYVGGRRSDHFYTTDLNEVKKHIDSYDYNFQGSTCGCWKTHSTPHIAL